MKANMWLGIVSLGVVLFGGKEVYTAIGNASANPLSCTAGKVASNKEYIKAKNAIETIHKNIEVAEVDLENGEIILSIWNPTQYTFNSLMIDVEFINSNGEAYYYETVFLTDGLLQNQLEVLSCVVTDKEKLKDAVSFNFFIQGF